MDHRKTDVRCTLRDLAALLIVTSATAFIVWRMIALGHSDPRDPYMAVLFLFCAVAIGFGAGARYGSRVSRRLGEFVGYMEGQRDAAEGLHRFPLRNRVRPE
ncbi:MAG TPA: hypothetical protein VF731_00710 [Solirubrobacterales bacterium]